MAFENNQQDAFNLRNGTESLKLFQAELDKATTSIGAAEVAAENELAQLKLRNLAMQQEMQIHKLDELIEREAAGIRKLAALRLELSDKQFELRKKEIQKELQLLADAINELQSSKTKEAKTTKGRTKERASDADMPSTSGVILPTLNKKAQTSKSERTIDPKLIRTVDSIDKTLKSFHSTVAKNIHTSNKNLLVDSTPAPQPDNSSTKSIQAATKSALVEDQTISQNTQFVQKIESDESSTSKDSKSITQPELINLVSSIDHTVASLLATVSTQAKKKDEPTDENRPRSTADNLKDVTQQQSGTDGDGTKVTDKGTKTTGSGEDRNYPDESGKMKAVHLGTTSLQDITAGLDELRKTAEAKKDDSAKGKQATEDPAVALLESIISKAEEDAARAKETKNNGAEAPEPQLSQTTLDLGGELLKGIAAAQAAEEEFQEFKKNQEFNAQIIRQTQEQKRLEELHQTELNLLEARAKMEADIAFSRAHNDEIRAQELQQKRLDDLKDYDEHQKKAGKFAVKQEKFEKDKRIKENKAARKEAAGGVISGFQKLGTGEFSMTDIKKSYGEYMGQRTAELKANGMNKTLAELTTNFELLGEVSGNLAQQLTQQADVIGEKQAPIDTRLQGSTANDKMFGSYWRQLVRDMNKIGAVNPYFKQEDFANNIAALVDKGISFNIKQRAFLDTISDKIATTFEVADGTLLRLIRIQQQDTTAGRLGMESALNSFLNSMYENTEYLKDVASSVRSSLLEMQAFEAGDVAAELEFQVQKWMGSLYSVGMSQEAVQGIAQAFGQIASGDVSGLTGNGTGNLLIMAANEAGKSIADILQGGLDAKETNELMQAMVNYLAEIAETSSDSRVVQQQLANVYGLKASDLKAATNLATSIKDVSKQDLTYSGMLGQLNKMANSMILRTSTGEMLTNVWDNTQYTMASQMTSNPILYLLPKVATLLEDFAGGIDLPFLNVMGFGVDLNTSVAQLMNVAAMSGTILSALGPMISGLGSAASGSIMLSTAGIDTKGKAPVIARGSAQPLQNLSGSSISESGLVGNASGDDVKKQTMQGAEDDKKKQMVEAKDNESADDIVIRSQQAVISIYELLEEVAHGSQSLRVRVISNGNSAGGGGTSGGQNTVMGGADGDVHTGSGLPGGTDNGNWVIAF